MECILQLLLVVPLEFYKIFDSFAFIHCPFTQQRHNQHHQSTMAAAATAVARNNFSFGFSVSHKLRIEGRRHTTEWQNENI